LVKLSKHSGASAGFDEADLTQGVRQKRGVGIGGEAKRHRVGSEKSSSAAAAAALKALRSDT
jgi:hypothetical protein